MTKNIKRHLTFLLCIFFLATAMTVSLKAAERNEAYWTDASTHNRLEQLVLSVGEERIICVKSEVPEGKTLKAYSFIVTYDDTKISVEAAASAGSTFPPTNINVNKPGTIIVNGFNITGITGPNTLSLIKVTIRALEAGACDLVVSFPSYGASTGDQFWPSTGTLQVSIR